MILAAKLDSANLTSLVPIATYGCECSDGTSSSTLCTQTPTCGSNVVNYVEVDTSAVYIPIMRYPGIPTAIPLKGVARMRVAQ